MNDNFLSKEKLKRQKYKERKKNKQKNGVSRIEINVQNDGDITSIQDIEELEEVMKGLGITTFEPQFEQYIEEEEEKNEEEEFIEESNTGLSKNQVRKYGRPSVSDLKLISRRPELIERCDISAPDPYSLAEIRNLRNAVPVPDHWSQKRRYLNYKRGTEITRYRLPLYIEKTGISTLRQALLDLDEKKSQAAKQRERTRPKAGLFDVSPVVLYDSFFKYQAKPSLTRFGELYSEGKEDRVISRHFKVGQLTQKLRNALGMGDSSPPPWLHKMQQIGPPPSYISMKIPGLNAPIPKGAQWGNGANGWGQVPLENGKPIFGGNPYGEPELEIEISYLWGNSRRDEAIEDGVH